MVPEYWAVTPTILAYLIIIALTCLTTAVLALFCSTVFHKTGTSLIVTYTTILVLYLGPIAGSFFAQNYFPESPSTPYVEYSTITSPFAAAFNFPLYMEGGDNQSNKWSRADGGAPGQWFGYPLSDLRHFGGYVLFTLILNAALFQLMIWLFGSRWRVSTTGGQTLSTN